VPSHVYFERPWGEGGTGGGGNGNGNVNGDRDGGTEGDSAAAEEVDAALFDVIHLSPIVDRLIAEAGVRRSPGVAELATALPADPAGCLDRIGGEAAYRGVLEAIAAKHSRLPRDVVWSLARAPSLFGLRNGGGGAAGAYGDAVSNAAAANGGGGVGGGGGGCGGLSEEDQDAAAVAFRLLPASALVLVDDTMLETRFRPWAAPPSAALEGLNAALGVPQFSAVMTRSPTATALPGGQGGRPGRHRSGARRAHPPAFAAAGSGRRRRWRLDAPWPRLGDRAPDCAVGGGAG